MFLSSLHCTDEDHSLLDDCAHSQLGLAVCDEDSGLAGAKCLGRDGKCFEQHLVYYNFNYAVIVFTSTHMKPNLFEESGDTIPERGRGRGRGRDHILIVLLGLLFSAIKSILEKI